MHIELTGRRAAALAMTRTAMTALALLVASGLGACTTVEGTNAMTDPVTFEREVMTSTLQGLGIVDKEVKPETTERRGPLVLPKDTASLPAPTTDSAVAALPTDSNSVQIDTAGLTEADLTRLRHARVVDLRTLAGRPLTDVEARQLTARFKGAQVKGKRSLYVPPDEYFTAVNGQDMVCLAESGELVPLNDAKCPTVIRRALAH